MIPDSERLRREAKKLRRAFDSGDVAARDRVAAHFTDDKPLIHARALHVVAREHGFPSWPRLKFADALAAMDRPQRAERLKIALYLGQHWIVEDLLASDPSLGRDNLGLACALYDLDEVKHALAKDEDAATRIVGVRSPMLHLAFSRHHKAKPELAERMIAVAEALKEHGADVNDSYPAEPGSEHRLSALYGALGHAGNLPLAEWLLEHGAEPNDNESLYHATELGHLEGVRLLMRFGVQTAGTNALLRMLDFDDLDGTTLMLDYGADPNEVVHHHPSGQPVPVIPALHQAARRGRDGRFADLLLRYGADPKALWNGHTAYALASTYGNTSFAEALAAAGHASELSEVEAVLAACGSGADEIEPGVLARHELNEEESRILTEVILWEDRLDQAKRLVAAGIDPNVTEAMGMTPLHLAAWAGLPEHVAWLLTLEPDLGHVNDYGGDLIGTIIHGSENRLDTDERDHVGCARLALKAGATIRQRDLDGAMNETMVAFLNDWVEAHPAVLATPA